MLSRITPTVSSICYGHVSNDSRHVSLSLLMDCLWLVSLESVVGRKFVKLGVPDAAKILRPDLATASGRMKSGSVGSDINKSRSIAKRLLVVETSIALIGKTMKGHLMVMKSMGPSSSVVGACAARRLPRL